MILYAVALETVVVKDAEGVRLICHHLQSTLHRGDLLALPLPAVQRELVLWQLMHVSKTG